MGVVNDMGDKLMLLVLFRNFSCGYSMPLTQTSVCVSTVRQNKLSHRSHNLDYILWLLNKCAACQKCSCHP